MPSEYVMFFRPQRPPWILIQEAATLQIDSEGS